MRQVARIRGQAMLSEIVVPAILSIIIAGLAFDAVIAVYGFSELDAATRDAARAAASGPVDLVLDTYGQNDWKIANQTLQAHKTDGVFVSKMTLDAYNSNGYVWHIKGTGSPYVTVTGRCRVFLPIPLNFFGAKLSNGALNYSRVYTYPILSAPFSSDVTTAPAEQAPPAPPPEAAPAAAPTVAPAAAAAASPGLTGPAAAGAIVAPYAPPAPPPTPPPPIPAPPPPPPAVPPSAAAGGASPNPGNTGTDSGTNRSNGPVG